MISPHTHPHPDHTVVGPPDGQRPVFVRYDKEEAEDVEISLASDSDDSVVIVPPGMLDISNQQEESLPTPGATTAPLPGADTVSMGPTTSTPATIDGLSLSNDLATSSPHLTSNSTPVNSFPPSNVSVVSLVPPMNPNTPSGPGALGEPLPGRPQLQQMLMQPSSAGPMGLPLQMHQLQNQLSQPSRQLQHPPAPPPANNEDSAVININSTDEEDEEEDMEDEEELDEDDEEGLDEEEEEGSEYAGEEFYDGEEYDEYDEEELEEEEEEEEEEEDEEGDIPPLEGSEDKGEESGTEEVKAVQEAGDEGAVEEPFSVEGETEGGIEEVQSRHAFPEDKLKVQEVESIGVLEEARESEGESSDPTMPQILCVTGGALEEEEEETTEGGETSQEKAAGWEQEESKVELDNLSGKQTANQNQQEEPVCETSQEAGGSDSRASTHQEEEPAVALAGHSAGPGDTAAGPATSEQEEKLSEGKEQVEVEHSVEAAQKEGEEGKGVKRKREEEPEQSTEKKKCEDDAMASMLADFVPCPPDDEEVASGSNQSNPI